MPPDIFAIFASFIDFHHAITPRSFFFLRYAADAALLLFVTLPLMS